MSGSANGGSSTFDLSPTTAHVPNNCPCPLLGCRCNGCGLGVCNLEDCGSHRKISARTVGRLVRPTPTESSILWPIFPSCWASERLPSIVLVLDLCSWPAKTAHLERIYPAEGRSPSR